MGTPAPAMGAAAFGAFQRMYVERENERSKSRNRKVAAFAFVRNAVWGATGYDRPALDTHQ